MRAAGRGRRLGGRDLRGGEVSISREGDAARRPVSRLVASSDSSAGQSVSRRVPARASNARPRRNASVAKLLLAPVAALRRAAQEGAPLAVHAGFAVGCVLLQQIMARHAPEGILSTRVVRALPLVLERSLRG